MKKLLPIFLVLLISGCFSDNDNKPSKATDTTIDTPNDSGDNNADDDFQKPNDNAPDDTPADSNNNDDDQELNITGIWDKTENLDNLGVDELYIAIDADGTVTTYDYDGDSYDRGDDCYYAETSLLRAVKQTEDTYQFVYAYTEDTLQVQLTLDDNQLNFTSLEDNSELKFNKEDKGSFGRKTQGLSTDEFDRKLCEY